jgi:ABC-2 type transport system ATP-binding protein
MTQSQSLNDVFAQLSAQGVVVTSMRNKVNRLEELFMRLVDANSRPAAAPTAAPAATKLTQTGSNQ